MKTHIDALERLNRDLEEEVSDATMQVSLLADTKEGLTLFLFDQSEDYQEAAKITWEAFFLDLVGPETRTRPCIDSLLRLREMLDQFIKNNSKS